MAKPNLVLFDFCETLVNFQTAFPFIDEVIQKCRPNRYKWYIFVASALTKLKVYTVANKFFPSLNLSKRVQLAFIRGISQAEISSIALEFYQTRIKPNYHQNVLQKMIDHQQQGDVVFISSGGYQPYLELFCQEYQIPQLFCSTIDFNNQKATGLMQGPDCMFHHKVELLEAYLKQHPIEYQESYFYSDSSSDLPLLKWVHHGVVISADSPQQWASNNNLQEWLIHQ